MPLLLNKAEASLELRCFAISPAQAAELTFTKAGPAGFEFADAKLGKGKAPVNGQKVAIDYVMSTSGARYGTATPRNHLHTLHFVF